MGDAKHEVSQDGNAAPSSRDPSALGQVLWVLGILAVGAVLMLMGLLAVASVVVPGC